MAQKLGARGFDSEEIESVCGRLEESGLLDDLECARGMVEGTWRRRGYGPLRMRAELERRGVDGRIIDTVLRESASHETDMAEEAARRWLRTSGGSREALARHLSRRGYSGEVVYDLLTRFAEELDDR